MAQLLTSIKFRSTTAAGLPNAFGKLYTYAAGTLTPQATYTTAAGNVANTNPVTLGADGCAQIWLDPALSYRFIETTAALVPIPGGDVDNIGGEEAFSVGLGEVGGAGLVGFSSAESYPAGTVGHHLTVSVAGELDELQTNRAGGHIRRRVPALFVRGDGNTRTDVFPLCVRHPGPGGVEVNKTPLEIARGLGNVIAREDEADVWVSPAGAGTFAGTSRANAMSWAAAFRTLATGRKLLLIDSDGPYPPLSLVSGTHAGAAVPKWLYAVDGRVRMAAETSLGQPDTQTWTAHTGAIYKTVLSSADYDRPQCVLASLVPDVRDGQPKSIRKYASVAELSALGTTGEGWYFDPDTDTLYLTYFANDLTVLGNRNFKIIYSSKTLDSTGEFSAEWLLGGCTVILEGLFEMDGITINSYEASSTLPIFIAEGRLMQLCATSYGLRAEGLTYTSGRRCYRPKFDGLNGYKSAMSGTVGMTIEHDLVVIGAGDIGTYGTGNPHNRQGFSAHGAHNAMVFGALFEGNDGQGWADICDSTHDSASWGVGVISRDNYVDTESYGFYMDGSAGAGTGSRAAWLDTCVSEANTRDLGAITSDVQLFNCQLETQITAASGTIADYSPEAP